MGCHRRQDGEVLSCCCFATLQKTSTCGPWSASLGRCNSFPSQSAQPSWAVAHSALAICGHSSSLWRTPWMGTDRTGPTLDPARGGWYAWLQNARASKTPKITGSWLCTTGHIGDALSGEPQNMLLRRGATTGTYRNSTLPQSRRWGNSMTMTTSTMQWGRAERCLRLPILQETMQEQQERHRTCSRPTSRLCSAGFGWLHMLSCMSTNYHTMEKVVAQPRLRQDPRVGNDLHLACVDCFKSMRPHWGGGHPHQRTCRRATYFLDNVDQNAWLLHWRPWRAGRCPLWDGPGGGPEQDCGAPMPDELGACPTRRFSPPDQRAIGAGVLLDVAITEWQAHARIPRQFGRHRVLLHLFLGRRRRGDISFSWRYAGSWQLCATRCQCWHRHRPNLGRRHGQEDATILVGLGSQKFHSWICGWSALQDLAAGSRQKDCAPGTSRLISPTSDPHCMPLVRTAKPITAWAGTDIHWKLLADVHPAHGMQHGHHRRDWDSPAPGRARKSRMRQQSGGSPSCRCWWPLRVSHAEGSLRASSVPCRPNRQTFLW